MSYQRVIPRDLFNEAKLLKCLGQLALYIHDYRPSGLQLIHFAEDEGFRIEQDPNDGALYCANMELVCAGSVINLRSPYNCKDAYPLRFADSGAEEEGRVFNEDGTLSNEFRNLTALLESAPEKKETPH